MAGLTANPLFVAVLLVATLFAAGSTLPLFGAALVATVQTVLAGRWLYRYGQGVI